MSIDELQQDLTRINEQLDELLGQEVILTMICYGHLVEDDPITGTLQRLSKGDYLVGRWQFSSKFVDSVQSAKIVFDLDLEGESLDPNDCYGPADEAYEMVEAMREGEAHMAELRKMGWDG